MAGLHDEPRFGAPRTIDEARIEAVIVRTLENCSENATHCSPRDMAKASGLSVSTVRRIWRAFGLQPHRMATFKLSTDPNFVVRVRDVVGLNVSPRVIRKCQGRLRAAEFHKLLDEIEARVTSELDVRLVMDNYATHDLRPGNWTIFG
ncbi:Putative transposase fragment [Bradyrhizobium sp. ORS 285]|uniref:helix-turn-helix domain-containing protein n=1 Tax=Bradyrhizobium sp. ORS 285 TaxID=115808 RepID=UPI000B4190BB|nr:helix-turn-helix domain-containing protein [Bradyrhizobium sp. ORS 285]SMX56379.1 Putative transposase fragment [Bradyrhizobium sp. ORS 285]